MTYPNIFQLTKDTQFSLLPEFNLTQEALLNQAYIGAQRIGRDLNQVVEVRDIIKNVQLQLEATSPDLFTNRDFQKYVTITLESLYTVADYKPSVVLTNESIGDKDFKQLTLESISEYGKKLWQQIVKAFKVFVEFLKKIFTGNAAKASHIEKKALEINHEAKEAEKTPEPKKKEMPKESDLSEIADGKVMVSQRLANFLHSKKVNDSDSKSIYEALSTHLQFSDTQINRRLHYSTVVFLVLKDYIQNLQKSDDSVEQKEKALKDFTRRYLLHFNDFVNVDNEAKADEEFKNYPITFINPVSGRNYVFNVNKNINPTYAKAGTIESEVSAETKYFEPLSTRHVKDLSWLVAQIAKKFNKEISKNLERALSHNSDVLRSFERDMPNIENKYLVAVQNYVTTVQAMLNTVTQLVADELTFQKDVLAYCDRSV